MKKVTNLGLAFILASVVSFVMSCNTTGPDKNPEVKFTATLSGANEFPRVAGNGAGTLDGVYNKDTKTFNYVITYSGMTSTPTAGHFHGGFPNENAGVIFPFAGSLQSPISGSWAGMKQADENRLFGGGVYVNLHTTLNKGGEIRGQISFVTN
jgi:hypothetical protein